MWGGSLAHALRKLNYKGKIIGVDAHGPYQGDTAYKEYEQLIFDDVRSPDAINQMSKYEYDNIVSVGLPPQAVRFILDNPTKFRLKKNGQMLVATDDIHPIPQHFAHFSGSYPADRNIFLYKKQ